MLQELSSCPAAMEAAKAADCYGLAPGHDAQQADATQAYTQSKLGGVPTWVRLPRDNGLLRVLHIKTLFVHYSLHFMDIQMREDIGNNIAKLIFCNPDLNASQNGVLVIGTNSINVFS